MAKLNDIPKDQPILIPASNRPSLAQLAELGTDNLRRSVRRAMPDDESGQVTVLAFNSSI